MTTDKEDLGIQAQERVLRPSRSGSEGTNRSHMPYSLRGLAATHPSKMLPSLSQRETGVGQQEVRGKETA